MRRVPNLFVYFILFLVVFPFVAFSQEDPLKKPETVYVIGTGDVLEIVTWKEPDFSRESVAVRLDGRISFPLLNDLDAAGKTPIELKQEIEKQLTDYVNEPTVTVSVVSSASKRFYILGEIANTGEFPLVKKLTVLQAFAVAGGFTEWASKKEIILFRRVDGEEKVIKIDYRDIIKGKDFSGNVEIQADDTIIVP